LGRPRIQFIPFAKFSTHMRFHDPIPITGALHFLSSQITVQISPHLLSSTESTRIPNTIT
jgi:hypothetical protein